MSTEVTTVHGENGCVRAGLPRNFAIARKTVSNSDVQKLLNVSKATATIVLLSLSEYLEVTGIRGIGMMTQIGHIVSQVTFYIAEAALISGVLAYGGPYPAQGLRGETKV